MAPLNQAAWLLSNQAQPLGVSEAPYTRPGPTEIVIRNGAVAVNPVDMAKQRLGNALLPHVKYPCNLGGDIAGEVVEVGSDVTLFKGGDRVLAHAVGICQFSNKSAEGAFQLYTYGLFHKDFLALELPKIPSITQDKAVIITSGSLSLGSNAIQLATAAGYEVFTTASPQNFDHCRRLGAKHVFDYHDATWPDEMVAALRDKRVAGAMAINSGALEACTRILARCDGAKVIANAGPPFPRELPSSILGIVGLMGSIIWWTLSNTIRGIITGVRSKFIDCSDLNQPEVAVAWLYREFLPKTLATGHFIPAPDPVVVGKGIEKIQGAVDAVAKGVSAQKIVVSL